MFLLCLSMWNHWKSASCPWPVGWGMSRAHLSSITVSSKKWVAEDLRRSVKEGGIKMPCTQDATSLTQGFYFAVHCDSFYCNSISIFLLHFKVAENNTLNRKMKYILCAACYPPNMHTSFNSNRNCKGREKGKMPGLSIFPVLLLK